MAGRKRQKITRKDVAGFKYFKVLAGLTEHLHDVYLDPQHPNKRVLHYDQYIALMLVYFFSPVCDSLRLVQKATEFEKVRRLLGVHRLGRSTIADAGKVFDPELLKGVIGQLAERVPEAPMSLMGRDDLDQVITLVDGSHLPGIARMLWADFQKGKNGAKAHVQFELARGVPVAGQLTPGNESEVAVFEKTLQKDRLYVLDRGYAKYALLQEILDAGSGFVVRLKDNAVFDVVEERELHSHALEAGVVRDASVRLGDKKTRGDLRQPIRIVEVECTPHVKRSGKTGRGGPERGQTILLATSRDDLTPQMISMIYQKRWAIEIFFRFFKHVLGCRHLLGESQNAITLQLYIAIIACLLIAIWTGRRPTKTVWGLVQFYLSGWATEEELIEQLNRLPDARSPRA